MLVAISLGNRAFYRELKIDEMTAYADEVDTITGNALHPDAQSGIAAFLEKRLPRGQEG
jgi:hypothetical protein